MIKAESVSVPRRLEDVGKNVLPLVVCAIVISLMTSCARSFADLRQNDLLVKVRRQGLAPIAYEKTLYHLDRVIHENGIQYPVVATLVESRGGSGPSCSYNRSLNLPGSSTLWLSSSAVACGSGTVTSKEELQIGTDSEGGIEALQLELQEAKCIVLSEGGLVHYSSWTPCQPIAHRIADYLHRDDL